MKRILIGIAAVFCAQIAFQTYLAVERTDNDFSTLTTPLVRPLIIAQPEIADLTIRESQQLDMRQIVRTRYISREQKTQPAYATYRKPATRDIQPTAAIFKPVIITAPPRTAATSARRTDQTPEKRSFPSKAVAVIKKPYNWLKNAVAMLK